jgi:signal transduction histidine kinase
MQIERHRALAQMVAGVAHEINTPLGIVNTAADIIKNRVDSEQFAALGKEDKKLNRIIEDVQEAAQLIEGNIRRAHKLVQDFKKISVNQVTDSLETVVLRELIETSVDLYKLNARQAHLKISIENRAAEALWEGYPASMTQVILNLLSNIERYAYDASGGNILILLDAGEKGFRLEVKDEGKGIPPENLPHIFDPFFTTGRSKGGTGLGMAIVYNLVTSMFGGTISLESQLGKGTTVIIEMPRHAPARTS